MTQATFSPEKNCILIFKGTDLFKLSLKTQQCLVNRLNEGYDRIFKKYNIIDCDRVTDVAKFQEDCGFSAHPDLCYFYAFVEKDPLVYLPLKESKTIKKDVFENYELFFITDKDESFLNLNEECIKSTAAFKPHHSYELKENVIEPTCFVSFLPRLGLFFLPFTERHFQTLRQVEKYVIEVIKEHDLVSYYSKYHNYKLTGEIFVPQFFDPETSSFPKDFKLNASFHLSVMEKST